MDNLSFLLAMSCLPAALLGIFKYKRVKTQFHPFILAMLLSLITELSIKAIILLESWTWYYIVGNIYYLINSILYYSFFQNVLAKKWKIPFWGVVFLALACQAINSIFSSPLQSLLLYAAVVYAIYILANAVQLLSNIVFDTTTKLFKNPLFYIATGCLIFNLYFIFTQTVYFTTGQTTGLTENSYLIEKTVNTFTYLIFAIAILWIPKKS